MMLPVFNRSEMEVNSNGATKSVSICLEKLNTLDDENKNDVFIRQTVSGLQVVGYKPKE